MKITIKKITAMLVMSTVLILGGCSETGELELGLTANDSEPVDDREFLKLTHMNQSKLYNMEMNYNMVMKMDDSNQSFDMTVLMDLESEGNGLMYMDFELLETPFEAYFDLSKTSVAYYMGVDVLGETAWVKDTASPEEFFNTESDYTSMANPFITGLASYVDFKMIKEESLEDSTQVRVYEITVNDSDLFAEILGDEASVQETFGLTKEQIGLLFEELTYTISIDVEQKLVRKIEVDLTEQLVRLIHQEQNKKVIVDEISISIELSKFNEVDVVIPDEVLSNATEADLLQ